MKPLWIQTLAWVAAVVVALLLALAYPDGMGTSWLADFSRGTH